MNFVSSSKDSMDSTKDSTKLSVSARLFLCGPFEGECGVKYPVEADHLCDLAFLSDTLASDDYLTFWMKQRHEESTMKRWKWWIMASECQQMLCLLTREPIWTTVFDKFERLKDYHFGFFFPWKVPLECVLEYSIFNSHGTCIR